MSPMALRIVCPNDLPDQDDTDLFAALYGLGAEYVCGTEWRYTRDASDSNNFRAKLRDALPLEKQNLAERATIETLRFGNGRPL